MYATYLFLLFGSSRCVVRWWFWWLLWCGCFSLNLSCFPRLKDAGKLRESQIWCLRPDVLFKSSNGCWEWCLLGFPQNWCKNNLFWNTSYQSVSRQNRTHWLAAKQKYIDFVDSKDQKMAMPSPNGQMCGQFLKTVWNMTLFWDIRTTWILSVAEHLFRFYLCCLSLVVHCYRPVRVLIALGCSVIDVFRIVFVSKHSQIILLLRVCWGFQQQQSWFPSENATGTDLPWRVQG